MTTEQLILEQLKEINSLLRELRDLLKKEKNSNILLEKTN